MSCSWNYIYVLSFDYSHTHIFMHTGAEPLDSLLHSVYWYLYHRCSLTKYLLVLLYVALLAVNVTVTGGSEVCQTIRVSTTWKQI